MIEILVAARLLGRHVQRRAEHHAGLGQPLGLLLLAGGAQRLGDAEVHDLDEVELLALQEEQVLGLDVAMHDALGMRGAQRGRGLRGDAQRALLGQLVLAREALGERFAIEVLHHHERAAVIGVADVVDVDDVLVADRARELRLLLESRDDRLALRILLEQDLHRDALADQGVSRLVDRTHPALTDLALDQVAARERGADDVLRSPRASPLARCARVGRAAVGVHRRVYRVVGGVVVVGRRIGVAFTSLLRSCERHRGVGGAVHGLRRLTRAHDHPLRGVGRRPPRRRP